MGALLMQRLAPLPRRFPKAVAELRGLGLMIGLKCVPPVYGVVDRLREAGLLTVPAADNVLRLLPPLTIEESHVDEACAILERTLGQLE
jgi:acetylornithine/N-succinyldiaminopimelate aminotransferase